MHLHPPPPMNQLNPRLGRDHREERKTQILIQQSWCGRVLGRICVVWIIWSFNRGEV